MNKFVRYALYGAGTLAAFAAGFAGFIALRGIPTYPKPPKRDISIQYTPEKIAHGYRIAQVQCIVCHSNLDGTHLQGKKLLELPAEFGEIYSANITHDPSTVLSKWTDGELITFLRTGLRPDGSYAPPYMPKFVRMSNTDIEAVVAWLRSDDPLLQPVAKKAPESHPSFLVKFLTNMVPAFKPLPYPSAPVADPDTNDLLAYGKYLALSRYDCFACHSKDFKTNNDLNPTLSEGFFGGGNPMLNMEGKTVLTANITPDNETGIGTWTEAEFGDVLRTGMVRKRGTTVRYPMLPYTRLEDKEVKALYAYLRSVPAIRNKVERAVAE